MEALKQRILKEGIVAEDNILKVDSFLNHQVDPSLMHEIAKEFRRLFADTNPTKILTAEASGIPIAMALSFEMNLPMLYAKKSKSNSLDGEVFHREIYSYTRGETVDIIVAKKFLTPDERILIVDDFLAQGRAILGLVEIVRQSGAYLCGCGIVVEKGFQSGGRTLRDRGVNLKSLAVLDRMNEDGVVFR